MRIQIYFILRVSPPPNPHLFPPDGPFSTVPVVFPFKFNEIHFMPICPYNRGNNSLFVSTSCHSASSPCHVSPAMPCTSRPPTVCYLAKDTPLITPSMCSTAKVPAGYHSLLHFTRQFRSSPFFNLNNEASLPLSFGGCARHAQTPLNLTVVELLSVLPSNTIHYNHSRAIRHFLYIEHPFIPLRL